MALGRLCSLSRRAASCSWGSFTSTADLLGLSQGVLPRSPMSSPEILMPGGLGATTITRGIRGSAEVHKLAGLNGLTRGDGGVITGATVNSPEILWPGGLSSTRGGVLPLNHVGKARYSGYSRTFGMLGDDNLPISVDWREYPAVTDVREQGSCGACWAIACTGALEGINAIKTQKLIKLSEQQLIDCVDLTCYGCGGGFASRAFEYIIDNGGQVPYDVYPYVGKQNLQYKHVIEMGVTMDNYGWMINGDEDYLKYLVSCQPVVVAVGADLLFCNYSGGVLDGPGYTIDELDELQSHGFPLGHWVLVVGYGISPDGLKYWLVKNSEGKHSGINGYVLLARDTGKPGGAFGITRLIYYPIKTSANGLVEVTSESDMVRNWLKWI